MKAADLRSRNASELKDELYGLLREQFNLRMQQSTNQLSNTSQIRRVRRDIARVKTVLNQLNG